MLKIKRNHVVIVYWLFIIGLLVYSRFVNLGWGLPYPMHPDERNMSVALQQLRCDEFSIFNFQFSKCFNPNFFAYGQFPLYLGYLLIFFYKLLVGAFGGSISFIEAVMSLRMISAIASVINLFVLISVVKLILPISKIKNQRSETKLSTLIFALVPFSIQFAHFGTTESLLMLFYSLIVYYSLLLIESKITNKKYILLSSLFSGLAIATKVSSLIFLVVPLVSFISKIPYRVNKDQRSKTRLKVQKFLIFCLSFVFCTLIFTLLLKI